MSFILRDYQLELVEGVQNSMLKGNKKILVQSAAGSGKSVTMAEIARRATGKGNRVMFVVHRRELVSQIKETFKLSGVNPDLCYIGMVQTVTRRLHKFKHEPQMILVDEAHHSLAKTYLRIFNHFPRAYTVGFTATPTLLSKRGLGEFYEDLIIGKSVQWLIDNGNLAPFNYYSVNMLDVEKLKMTRGDYSLQSIENATQGIIYGDVIENYQKYADNTRAIVYAYSVKASKVIAQTFREAGYKAQSVDGTTPKKERNKAMEEFRSGELTILVNAELYGEGVDVQGCETVILLRPTASLSLHIQQSMRPMRYKEGKKATIIDHVANYTRHGLPNTEHEWSLKGSKKAQEAELKIRECENCYAVYEPSKHDCCPMCGHVPVVEEKEKEYEEEKDAELKEITSDDFELTLDFRKPEDCKSLRELQDLAKAKNYKPGWAWHQAKRLQII